MKRKCAECDENELTVDDVSDLCHQCFAVWLDAAAEYLKDESETLDQIVDRHFAAMRLERALKDDT